MPNIPYKKFSASLSFFLKTSPKKKKDEIAGSASFFAASSQLH
jgi:hypothetical protein